MALYNYFDGTGENCMAIDVDLKVFALEFLRTLPNDLLTPEAQVKEFEGRWFDQHAPMVENVYGVYVIVTQSEAIAYIGKADKTSISKRLGNHLRAPNKDRDTFPERQGCLIYPNHRWIKQPSTLSNEISSGDFRVICFILKSSTFASLLEVALQLWCELHGGLPAFNMRIG
jgi:hypothetical protein